MQETALRQRLRLSDTGTLWITGLAFTLLHIATSGGYGFHRDELLTYTNALHLDWCYVSTLRSRPGSPEENWRSLEPV